MVQYKSLLVVLAAVSAVVASPCKPSTTVPVLNTATTVSEETSSIETSIVSDTTVDDSTAIATTTTTGADTTTTAAQTTTTADADVTTTTTVAETTSTAPADAAPTACGIYGYFVQGNTLQYITSPGTKDTPKDCVQACADYPSCNVVDYYNEDSFPYEKGTCEFWKGTVKTDGSQSPYQWYQASCLDSM
ncbi:uncharacterized protein FRV6_16360 [Fusarium oxysporum]|uniref:Apple domain-containing protein n=1 Tax=Fusarium oxysporum TaxID=5507 RepID=A0A2H3TUE9_FUSOX|nr:uncharacterized protein FRV6_16360 [Fusarium oxysporum]